MFSGLRAALRPSRPIPTSWYGAGCLLFSIGGTSAYVSFPKGENNTYQHTDEGVQIKLDETHRRVISRLPSLEDAQKTKIVRLPKFFSTSEVAILKKRINKITDDDDSCGKSQRDK